MRGDQVKWLLSTFLFLFVCSFSPTLVQAQPLSDATAPQLSSGIVIASAKGTGSRIYLADSTTNGIYYYDIMPGDPIGIKFEKFKLFYRDAALPEPSALAYKDGKLFVFDKRVRSIFKIDAEQNVEKKELSVVMSYESIKTLIHEESITSRLKPISFKEPISLSLSSNGDVVALAGYDSKYIVWYEPKSNKSFLIDHEDGIDDLRRVVFFGDNLLALNDERETYLVVRGLEPDRADNFESLKIDLPQGLATKIGDLADFSVNSDTYFFSNGRRVVSYTPDKSLEAQLLEIQSKSLHARKYKAEAKKGNTPAQSPANSGEPSPPQDEGETNLLPVIFENSYQVSPSQVVATDANVFEVDNKAKFVWKIQPSAITIKFLAGINRSNEILIKFYKHLFDNGLLPELEYESKSSERVEDILIEKGFLIAQPPKERNRRVPGPTQREQLARVICKLNKGLNKWTCDESKPLADEVLEKRVGRGQLLVLPDLTIKSLREKVEARGSTQTVAQYLLDHIPADELKQITPEYLMRINPSYAGTFEYEMTRQGFVAAVPTKTSLKPGSFFSVVNRVETDADSAFKGCADLPAFGTQEEKAPEFSKRMTFHRWSEYLPRRSANPLNMNLLSKLGIAKVEVQFANPVREFAPELSVDKIKHFECTKDQAYPNVNMVLSALKVTAGRYRLLDKDGLVIKLNESQLEGLGIAAESDSDEGWSFVVDSPYYVGYVPANLSRDKSNILSAHELKSGGSQDIFEQPAANLLLPAIRWQTTIMLDKDAYAKAKLSSLEESFKDEVFVLAHPDYTSKAYSYGFNISALTQTDIQKAQESHKTLLGIINFPLLDEIKKRTDINFSRIKIGILERSPSVDQTNPDFIRLEGDGTEQSQDSSFITIWLTRPANSRDDDPYEQLTIPRSNPSPTKKIKQNFVSDNDHGTHVAGILLANEKSDVPGLIPTDAALFLVDIARPNIALEELIRQAIEQNILIFNISQKVEPSSPDYMRQNMNTVVGWKSSLFVVAAGNDGKDLDVETPQQPLQLLLETHNMLGVSASEPDKKLLSEFEQEGNRYPGSNYGKKYVQLIAPGRDIYSLAVVETTPAGNKIYGYAKASGTSQAVPQVVATAAMMKAQALYDGIDGAVRIKARLIYTADWFSHYKGKVWGGFLNADRATFYPQRDIFWTTPQATPANAKTIYPINAAAWITIKNRSTGAYVDDPNIKDNAGNAPDRIRFDRILRMYHLGNQLYRVIYMGDDKRMRILMNAELEGTLRYKKTDAFDGSRFNQSSFQTAQELSVTQITDYISSISKMGQGILFSPVGSP